MRLLLTATIMLLLGLAPAGAQSTTPAKGGCSAAAEPATPGATGTAAGGTAPGNAGSTGFSGAGLGGAYTGTSQNGAVASSPSVQPVTAKGLDPIAAPAKAADPSKC